MKFWWTRNCAIDLMTEKAKAVTGCQLINTITRVNQSLINRLTSQLTVTCYQSIPKVFSPFFHYSLNLSSLDFVLLY